MSAPRTLICRVLITGSLILMTVFCKTAFAIAPGWVAQGAIAATQYYPAVSATPATYMQIKTVEYPYLQYRDGSYLPGTPSPYGPFTCVVQLYLNLTDPTNFQVVRTFQPRYPGNVYGAAVPVSSPSVSATPQGPNKLATNVTQLTVYPHPENPYGRETLQFYSLNVLGQRQTLLETQQILVYPRATAKIFNALSLVANPAAPIASPSPYPTASPYPSPSPYPLPSPSPFSLASSSPSPSPTPKSSTVSNFTGDPARLDVQIYNAYPGGDTWIVIYPGYAYPTPPSSAKEIPNTRKTAPVTDMIPERDFFIELGTAKDSSGNLLIPSAGTYTIQVLQNRPVPQDSTQPYGQETLATATFTAAPASFKVNGQVGKMIQPGG
ncbi:MAG: hypothetical protein WB696_26865 [Chthoniobacterales bacterium]|jgi:hypothetical protein